MPPLPVVSASEAIAAFERLGWVCNRFRNGHHVLVKPGQFMHLAIPDHRELKDGTLRKLLRSAEVSVDEFVAALER